MDHLDGLVSWDFPDRRIAPDPDSYTPKEIPDATPENMEFMMSKYNELVEVVNEMIDRLEQIGGNDD